MNATEELRRMGQSVWLDELARADMLNIGTLTAPPRSKERGRTARVHLDQARPGLIAGRAMRAADAARGHGSEEL